MIQYYHVTREFLNVWVMVHNLRFTDVHDYYRAQYFEVLDVLIGEISRRFDQDSLALPTAIEKLLIMVANKIEGADISVPSEAYSKDVDMKKLGRQLQMIPDLVSAYKSSQHLKLFKVTTIRIICDMLQAVPMAREMFSEVDKLADLCNYSSYNGYTSMIVFCYSSH